MENMTEVFQWHIDNICKKLSKETAPKLTCQLAFNNDSEVDPLFDYVVEVFSKHLKENMLQDMRGHGWKV